MLLLFIVNMMLISRHWLPIPLNFWLPLYMNRSRKLIGPLDIGWSVRSRCNLRRTRLLAVHERKYRTDIWSVVICNLHFLLYDDHHISNLVSMSWKSSYDSREIHFILSASLGPFAFGYCCMEGLPTVNALQSGVNIARVLSLIKL
jgi:hypothetical protein